MNFISTFEELNSLYEEATLAEMQAAEETKTVEEAGDNQEPEQEQDMPRQLVLECTNCGALAIKTEDEVTVDEKTDLANVEEECKFCSETKGYKVIGTFTAYDTTSTDETIDVDIVDDEEAEEAEESVEESLQESVNENPEEAADPVAETDNTDK